MQVSVEGFVSFIWLLKGIFRRELKMEVKLLLVNLRFSLYLQKKTILFIFFSREGAI